MSKSRLNSRSHAIQGTSHHSHTAIYRNIFLIVLFIIFTIRRSILLCIKGPFDSVLKTAVVAVCNYQRASFKSQTPIAATVSTKWALGGVTSLQNPEDN